MDPITTIALFLTGIWISTIQREPELKLDLIQAKPFVPTAARVPVAPATPNGIPYLDDPQPGAFVIVSDKNKRPVHVFAERAGLKFVKIDDGDRALIWRAYFITKKTHPNYTTSRYAPLDPLIGAKSGLFRKLKGKIADAIAGVGAFFALKFAKVGEHAAAMLTENTLLLEGGKSEQVAARGVVRDTADAFIVAVLDHPFNKKIRRNWTQTSLGPRLSIQAAPGEAIYIPTPEEIG